MDLGREEVGKGGREMKKYNVQQIKQAFVKLSSQLKAHFIVLSFHLASSAFNPYLFIGTCLRLFLKEFEKTKANKTGVVKWFYIGVNNKQKLKSLKKQVKFIP